MAHNLGDQFMYSEHKRKPVIRTQWCLPLIKELSNKLQRKLNYIGLPGIDALDIKSWIESLDNVIAFQCSEYKAGRVKKTIDVRILDDYFNDMERKSKLKSGIVYEGFVEDIVMGRPSDRGEIFDQVDFMNLYNLDFCNSLTTPRNIHDERGKLISYHKLEVINELLNYQNIAFEKNKSCAKFIMFLTINANSFNADTSLIKEKEYSDYFKKIKKINHKEVVAVRNLKAYCHYNLSKIFKENGFLADFFPPIFYFGSSYPNQHRGGRAEFHRMMTFTILGTKIKNQDELISQNVAEFLSEAFLFANDQKLKCFKDKFIDENEFSSVPDVLLKRTSTYKKYWS
ncbi:MAG TPA: hypothetical protein VK787_01180 [Puia sp.]|jgi:hypothetical protein|nr:hypothetical protein [Puia sp.]